MEMPVKIIVLLVSVLLVGCATSQPSDYEPPATTPAY